MERLPSDLSLLLSSRSTQNSNQVLPTSTVAAQEADEESAATAEEAEEVEA